MGVAHSAVVDAAFDAAGGIAHNAAAVGDHVGILGAGEAHVFHREFLQLQAAGGDAGVHLGMVLAGADAAGAVACHAAGEAFAADAALDAAIADGTVALPGDAAHIVQAGDLAVKRAVFNAAIAGAHKATHLAAAVIRLHPALQLQVFDAAALLQVAEKALVGAVGGQDKVPDGVAAAVKAAGKAGDGSKGMALQVNIRVQLHLQALGILHQGAIHGEVLQLLDCGDMQGLLLSIGAGQGQGQKQGRCQKQG